MAKKKTDEKKLKSTESKNDNEGLCSGLSYVIFGIIWYFADENMKKSELVKFHSKQGLNFVIVTTVVNTILGATFIFAWLLPLIGIGELILMILGIIAGLNKQKKELPIIGQFAEKYLTY